VTVICLVDATAGKQRAEGRRLFRKKKGKWRLTRQRAGAVSIRIFAGVYVRHIYRCYIQAGCYCIAHVKSESKRIRNQDVPHLDSRRILEIGFFSVFGTLTCE
jgi:hypothetical protein